MSSQRNLRLFIVILGLLLTIGCNTSEIYIDGVDVGELETETEIVELGRAEEVRVHLQFNAGELQVNGGADALMEAEFTYNVADWKPELEYDVNDDQGRLSVRQPRVKGFDIGNDAVYTWDIAFNEDVPMNLRIEFGAGAAEINVGDLHVTSLDVDLGAGDVAIDLSGNTTLTDLEFDMGAGESKLDLTGNWDHDVDADIQGGIGTTTLYLPSDIGVLVNVTKGLGSITAHGLEKVGDNYVNAAYDEADVVLEITIQAGIGEIVLEAE